MLEWDTLVKALQTGGLVTGLILYVYALHKGWIHTGADYDKVDKAREYWQDIALKGINAAEDLSGTTKAIVGKLAEMAAQAESSAVLLKAMETEQQKQKEREEWEKDRDRDEVAEGRNSGPRHRTAQN
jgi:predicted molibdopterin-dependent oxidoreductase YjgC